MNSRPAHGDRCAAEGARRQECSREAGVILAAAANRPQLRETADFYLVCGGFGLLLFVGGGYLSRVRMLKAQRKLLQQLRDDLEGQVRQRTAELAKSVSLLHATIESTADGVLVIDRQRRIVTHNRKFAEIWLIPPEKIASGGEDELLPFASRLVKDESSFLARVRELYDEPKLEAHDIVELKDGRMIARYSFPQLLGSEIVGRVWSFRDVTDQKRSECEMVESRNFLDRIINSISDPIFVKNSKHQGVLVNNAFCDLIGSGREDLLGKSDDDQACYSANEAETFKACDQAVLDTGIENVSEETLTSTTGKTHHLITKKTLYIDEKGEKFIVGVARDVTRQKEVERQLVEVSRKAGMAEVATSVLHNVGNVLNSVNVSMTLVAETIKRSKSGELERLSALVREHRGDLAGFLTSHPKGRLVPDYLDRLAEYLVEEQAGLLGEIESMRKNIEHIKDIVMMQQNYAKVSGVTEKAKAEDLVEDAFRMNSGALTHHHIEVIRDYSKNVPDIMVDRHKVLQILINLIRNATHACDEAGGNDKQMTVRIRHCHGMVRISVADNGVGIPPQNMTRIFNHGFTTRKSGHGFGLHSGALAAREMGGSLRAHSDGPGRGACFNLELPLQPPSLHRAANRSPGELAGTSPVVADQS